MRLTRFERELMDGNELSWFQMLFFVPLLLWAIACAIVSAIVGRELPE